VATQLVGSRVVTSSIVSLHVERKVVASVTAPGKGRIMSSPGRCWLPIKNKLTVNFPPYVHQLTFDIMTVSCRHLYRGDGESHLHVSQVQEWASDDT
jgi:hypothetical protein